MLNARAWTRLGWCLVLICAGCRHPRPADPAPEATPPAPAEREDDRGSAPGAEPSWSWYTDLRQETYGRNGGDNDPSISPDGRSLLFSSTAHASLSNVYLKPLEGMAVTQLTTGVESDLHPAFSPDGTRIAFASRRAGNADIYIVKVADPATAYQVTEGPAEDLHPTWSPDGLRLAWCSRFEGEDWQLCSAELRTRKLTNLGPGMYPVWSPKGDWIAFQRPRYRDGGWFGVWKATPDGSRVVEVVSSDEWAAIAPAWSPDGERLVFASVNKSAEARAEARAWAADDLWIVNADGTGLYQLTHDPAPDWNPHWAADGRIYFVSRRKGAQNIWSLQPRMSLLGADGPAK